MPIPARPLHANDLDPDPFVQFQRWYDDAEQHGQLQPDAMVVATSTPGGRPSARMVLLRGIDERGFCFYTNFDSRKGEELAANPHAAIALHWPEVLRQVRARGPGRARRRCRVRRVLVRAASLQSGERVGVGAERAGRQPRGARSERA